MSDSPTNEERARDPIVEACQGCGHCDYDEAEGGIVAHCKACLVKISRAVHTHYYSQLAAAEARGLERAREAIRDPKLRPNGGAETRTFIDKLDAAICALKEEK